MSRVLRRPRAEQDLFEIAFYIARESLPAAERFIDEIREKLDLLATSPRMGRARPELARNLRSFPVGNHVIFYRPLKDGIDVVRILHAARDLPSLF